MLTTSGLRQLRVTLVAAAPFEGQADGFYGTWFDITGMKSLELRRFAVIAQDISERKRLEAEVAALRCGAP